MDLALRVPILVRLAQTLLLNARVARILITLLMASAVTFLARNAMAQRIIIAQLALMVPTLTIMVCAVLA